MSNGITRRSYTPATAPGSVRFGWADLPEAILRELGGLFSEWGFVEIQMDALLSSAIGHPGVGLVLRKELHTSRQRRSVLAALIDVTLPSDLTREVSMIVGDYNRLAEERGIYAHGVWGVHEGYPGSAVISKDDAAMRAMHPDLVAAAQGKLKSFAADIKQASAVVTVKDLQRFRDATKKTSDRIHGAMFELQNRRRAEEIRAALAARAVGGE